MKKIFTLLASALFAVTVSAESYTGALKVTVNGITTDAGNANVEMTPNGDGTCNFSLKNFMFVEGGQQMPVGTINLTDIPYDKASAVAVFSGDQNLTIADGDDPNVGFWMGSMLGEMPIFIQGSTYNGKMKAVILIDANKNNLGVIKVLFGENADEVGQIPNSGFEKYHKAGSIDEANAWHSFGSCDGKFASMVKGTAHTEAVKDVCPGTTGTTSLRIFSTSILGISANGTVTTGRMSAGSVSATDKSNHAYLDMSKTDVDGNGDPFYAALTAFPDSIGVWMKYNPGKSGLKASISAVITDGTYYQDPEDKTYNNVVAKASNTNIEENGGSWQYVTVPFDYASYEKPEGQEIAGRAMLVTMSTCATPGGGTGNDNLYVDDLRLIYNYKPQALVYNGVAFADFATDKFEYTLTGVDKFDEDFLTAVVPSDEYDESKVVVEDEENPGNGTVYYTLISGDFQNTVTYTIHYAGTTGINGVENTKSNGVAGIYDLSGRRVSMNAVQHGVFIIRTADGKTYKVNK